MNEKEWDDLCTQACALPATIAEQLAIRDERIGDLKAALDDVLGEVAWLSRRLAELEAALEPFAKLEAQAALADNAWTSQYVLVGDVRRAKRALDGAGGLHGGVEVTSTPKDAEECQLRGEDE